MKPQIQHILLALALLSNLNLQLSTCFAQGTAFTYQGRLNDGSNPANGNYDLRFAVYNAPQAGSMAGGPVTNAATAVSNGLFTVTLDFGSGVFDGSAFWLDVGVRTNGTGSPGFTALSPRQALTPTAVCDSGCERYERDDGGWRAGVGHRSRHGQHQHFRLGQHRLKPGLECNPDPGPNHVGG